MDFPISGEPLPTSYLIAAGFVIGIFGGLFGVGGSFLAGPALLLMGMRANFTVGTDLAHIVGKSVVAAKKHWALGNVDFKLGGVMAFGTVAGAEIGAQLIEWLKRVGRVETVIAVSYLAVLLGIAAFMTWESLATLKMKRRQGISRSQDFGLRIGARGPREDENAFSHVARAVQGFRLAPMISLPVSGLTVSLWVVLGVALVGGIFSGFLGGGAGYIRMPSMVYLLGVPTHVAVGTDLFEIIISAGYGTISHSLKGNVDILVALVMNTGAAIGAQIGVIATRYLRGPMIRLAFVPLPLIGAGLVAYHRFLHPH